VSSIKATAGWKANSYVIFDYVDESDYKFAGVDVSNNKLVIGHRATWGWAVDKSVNFQAIQDTVYNLLISINGVNATVVVDNKLSVTHTFQPRLVDGFSYGLNYGMVGVGSDSARGTFDNVKTLVLPPQTTFQNTEDFGDGIAQLLPQIGLLRRRQPIRVDSSGRLRPAEQVGGMRQKRIRQPQIGFGNRARIERRAEPRLIGFLARGGKRRVSVAGGIEAVQIRVVQRPEKRIELWRRIVSINPCRYVLALGVELLLDCPQPLSKRVAVDPLRCRGGRLLQRSGKTFTVGVSARDRRSGGERDHKVPYHATNCCKPNTRRQGTVLAYFGWLRRQKEAAMNEQDGDRTKDENLDEEMERDTEIRRETQIRGSLGVPPSGRDESIPEFERGDDEDRESDR